MGGLPGQDLRRSLLKKCGDQWGRQCWWRTEGMDVALELGQMKTKGEEDPI